MRGAKNPILKPQKNTFLWNVYFNLQPIRQIYFLETSNQRLIKI